MEAPATSASKSAVVFRLLSEDEYTKLQASLKREVPAGESKEVAKIRSQLNEFAASSDTTMDFPASLSSVQRKAVHDIAEDMHYEHFSSGKGNNRYVTVKKQVGGEAPPRGVREEYVSRGYVGLSGLYVDYQARLWRDKVKIPPSCIAQREKRDGSTHHITIIAKPELSSILSNPPSPSSSSSPSTPSSPSSPLSSPASPSLPSTLVPSAANSRSLMSMDALLRKVYAVPDDWKAIGVGKATEDDNEAFFLVVDWPAANEMRRSVGLPPKDFHITLGFKIKDIHEPHAKKGPESLITLP